MAKKKVGKGQGPIARIQPFPPPGGPSGRIGPPAGMGPRPIAPAMPRIMPETPRAMPPKTMPRAMPPKTMPRAMPELTTTVGARPRPAKSMGVGGGKKKSK